MDHKKLLLKNRSKISKSNLKQIIPIKIPLNINKTIEKSIHIINHYPQPINQIKGYVINLKKRPDRLERFKSNVINYLPNISIEIIEAVDGETLDFKDNLLIKRFSEWIIKRLNSKLIKGIVGCCISHLECINRIANGEDNYAIVFEDDCVFEDINKQNTCNEFLKNLEIPEKFGVIYLNSYEKIETINCNNKYLNKVLSGFQTTESYIVSKDFAKIIYDDNINNIGAIDAHLGMSMLKNPDYPFYELKDKYFIQYNRNDSNIR